MSSYGDLVWRLTMDSAPFRDGAMQAIQTNNLLRQSVEATAARVEQQAQVMEQMGRLRLGTPEMARHVDSRVRQSEVSYAAEVANTEMMRAEFRDVVLQSNEAASSIERFKQAALSATAATERLGVVARSAAAAEAQLATSIANLQSEAIQAASTNQTFAATLTNEEAHAARTKIALEQLTRQELAYQAQTRAAAAANVQFSQTELGKARAMREAQAVMDAATDALIAGRGGGGGLRGVASASGRTQAAISQMVYAVDDAAASYGTGGLAGAVRGAANNISGVAMLLGGPWVGALAVGATAAIQLGMAFAKSGEQVDDAKERLKSYGEELKNVISRMETQAKLIGKARSAKTTVELDTQISDRKATLAESDLVRDGLQRRIDEQVAIAERAREFAARLEPKIGVWGTLSGAGTIGMAKAHERALAEAAAADEKAGLIGQEMNGILEKRRAIEEDLAFLGRKRAELWQKETQAAGVALDAQKRMEWHAARQAEHMEKMTGWEDRKAAMQSVDDLRVKLLTVGDQAAQIAKDFKDASDLLAKAAPSDEATLRQQLQDRAVKRIADLAPKALPNQGPSGAEAGSRESLTMIRDAMLRASAPKEDIQKQQLAALNKLNANLEKLSGINEKQKTEMEKLNRERPELVNIP